MAQGRSTKIISMIGWIRTSRLSIKNSLSGLHDIPALHYRSRKGATGFWARWALRWPYLRAERGADELSGDVPREGQTNGQALGHGEKSVAGPPPPPPPLPIFSLEPAPLNPDCVRRVLDRGREREGEGEGGRGREREREGVHVSQASNSGECWPCSSGASSITWRDI